MEDQKTAVAEILNRLKAGSQKLGEHFENLNVEFDKIKSDQSLTDALILYYEFKTTVEALNDALKPYNKMKQFLQYTYLVEIMNREDVKTTTVDSLGFRFTKSNKLNAKPNPNSDLSPDELRSVIHDWLRENGGDSLIKETVNAQALSSFAKSYMVDEGKDLPEELFEVSTTSSISMTKAR